MKNYSTTSTEFDANKIGWHCGVFATIAVVVAGVAFLFAEKE